MRKIYSFFLICLITFDVFAIEKLKCAGKDQTNTEAAILESGCPTCSQNKINNSSINDSQTLAKKFDTGFEEASDFELETIANYFGGFQSNNYSNTIYKISSKKNELKVYSESLLGSQNTLDNSKKNFIKFLFDKCNITLSEQEIDDSNTKFHSNLLSKVQKLCINELDTFINYVEEIKNNLIDYDIKKKKLIQ